MNENKTTMSTKEMPDAIHDLAVRAKEETKKRIDAICSSGSPSDIMSLIRAIDSETPEIQLVLNLGSFSWDAKNKIWMFRFPATREVMKDIGPDEVIRTPNRMCARISYIEEDRRGIDGVFRVVVNKTITWGK